MNNKKAAIYARVSTEEQVKDGFSIQAQLSELDRYAAANNIEIVAKYIDEGASGKSITGRPYMKRLLKDAQERKFDTVMVYKIDRLARKLRDALEISDTLEQHNVKLISLNENFDTSTAFGRTAFQMLCSFAELERNTIVDRVKMGMIQRAKEGKYNGGIVLGYDSVDKFLVINNDEAILVRKIFDYAEQDMGLKAITRRLNEMGYKTKKGKPFSTYSIKTILNNPIYIGKIRFNQLEDWSEKRRSGKNADYILVDGVHEPIISKEQWDNVQRIIQKRSYKPVRSKTPFILSGLIKCPQCGAGMVAGRSKGAAGKSYRYYICGQFHNKGKSVCSSHAIRADMAEQHVIEELTRIVNEPYILRRLIDKINQQRRTADQPIQEERKLIQGQLSKLDSNKNKIMNNMMNDPDLIPIFKPKLLEIQEEQKILSDRLAGLNEQLSIHNTNPIDHQSLQKLLTDFHVVLQEADPNERKSLYQLIIKDIQITIEAPRGVGRRIKRINLHFDFTIDSLFDTSYELLNKVYPDYIESIDPGTLDYLNKTTENGYRDLMKSLSILPLAMIRFPPIYLKRTINLLHQHQPHELVRQGHAAKAQPHVRAADHLGGEPEGSAHNKGHLAAPIGGQIRELRG